LINANKVAIESSYDYNYSAFFDEALALLSALALISLYFASLDDFAAAIFASNAALS